MMVDETDLAAALKALTESRARFGDMEARAAELEAVVQAMGEATDVRHGSKLDRLDQIAMLYATSRSVVLADRDREVAAREREAIASDIDNGVVEYDDLRPTDAKGTYWTSECVDRAYDSSGVWTGWLRRTAIAIRKGTT